MSDPYFQQLFADRIGGAQYGKTTAIYKFEKIKRAKRTALADRERELASLLDLISRQPERDWSEERRRVAVLQRMLAADRAEA